MKFHQKMTKNPCCGSKSSSGGAGEVSFDFLVCHGVLLLINRDRVKNKFLAGRTPFPAKMKNRKCRFWQFFAKKNQIFEIVAEISDRNFCRKFWQHDGDPLPPNCPDTRFYKFLCIIRRVNDF